MESSAETAATEASHPDVQLAFRRVPGSSVYEVTLPSGGVVKVERSRARTVPGLGGLGPATGALYELALAELGEEVLAGSVVDLGAGCGLGVRQILARAKTVFAVEQDPTASALAEVFAARATVIRAAVETARLATTVDGAVFVDALGFVTSPLPALRAARAMLRRGGRLVIVEPLAYPSQVLIAPARRAMVPATLATLVESAGFALLRCTAEGGIVVATCEAVDADDAIALGRGADALQQGNADRALEYFDQAALSGRHNVAVQAVLDAVDVLVAQGRADDACSRLLAVLRRFPDEARALAALSQFMVAAGEPQEAKMLAQKASRLLPVDAGVMAAMAIALQVVRDADAPAYWRKAFNLAPDAVEIAIPAAASALECAHPLLAERMLNRCMSYEGNVRPDTLVMRARVRMALGRREDAKLDARLALAADPLHEEARALAAALDDATAA